MPAISAALYQREVLPVLSKRADCREEPPPVGDLLSHLRLHQHLKPSMTAKNHFTGLCRHSPAGSDLQAAEFPLHTCAGLLTVRLAEALLQRAGRFLWFEIRAEADKSL